MSQWEGWGGDDRLQAHCDRLNAMPHTSALGWHWYVAERNGHREIQRKDGKAE